MLKVNLSDGSTLRYDLNDPADVQAWTEKAKNHSFQSKITGLTVALNGVSYSLPRPKDFGEEVFLYGEKVEPDIDNRIKGGEAVVCHAGDIQVVLMVHSSQRAARVDVTRPGKMRYNPYQGK